MTLAILLASGVFLLGGAFGASVTHPKWMGLVKHIGERLGNPIAVQQRLAEVDHGLSNPAPTSRTASTNGNGVSAPEMWRVSKSLPFVLLNVFGVLYVACFILRFVLFSPRQKRLDRGHPQSQ